MTTSRKLLERDLLDRLTFSEFDFSSPERILSVLGDRNNRTLDERIDYLREYCAFVLRHSPDVLINPSDLAKFDVLLPFIAEMAQAVCGSSSARDDDGTSNRAYDFACCIQMVAELLHRDFEIPPGPVLLQLREAIHDINANLFLRLAKLESTHQLQANVEAVRVCLSVAALHKEVVRTSHQRVLPFEALSILVGSSQPVGGSDSAQNAVVQWLTALELLKDSFLVDYQNTAAQLPLATASQMATAIDGLCSRVELDLSLLRGASVDLSSPLVELYTLLVIAAPRSVTAPIETAMRRLALVAIRAVCSLILTSASATTKDDVLQFLFQASSNNVDALLLQLHDLADILDTAARHGTVFGGRIDRLHLAAKTPRQANVVNCKSDAEEAALKALQRCLADLLPVLRRPYFAERAHTGVSRKSATTAAKQQLKIDRAWLTLLTNVAAAGIEAHSFLPATCDALTEDARQTMIRLSRTQKSRMPADRLEVFVRAVESAAQLRLPLFSTTNASMYVTALSKTIKTICVTDNMQVPDKIVEQMLSALSQFEDDTAIAASSVPTSEPVRFQWMILKSGAQEALIERILIEYRPGRASFGQLCRLFYL